MSSTPTPPSPNKPQPSQHAFQAPTGTRDFYPAELNRLRYIQDAWRRTSINHGFDEIDGPTFEHLELYTAKSGEGIVSELFSFERFGGEKTFALRPEFTPTLARMYASKAASLPKPTKWFWQQNCYRAERPQRGRLREFSQWNCDIIGDDSAAADAECIACCVGMLQSLKVTQREVSVRLNNRRFVEGMLLLVGVPEKHIEAWFVLMDRMEKSNPEEFLAAAAKIGTSRPTAKRVRLHIQQMKRQDDDVNPLDRLTDELHQFAHKKMERFGRKLDKLRCQEQALNIRIDEAKARGDFDPKYISEMEALTLQHNALFNEMGEYQKVQHRGTQILQEGAVGLGKVLDAMQAAGLRAWTRVDLSIVRGLAYYTGMVFEVHEASGAERAIAGGGRYDKLIETFGGPPTPAVGFGMGDVVLSLVLQDKGLMPSDEQIAEKLGQRPDALVIAYEDKNDPEKSAAAEAAIAPTLATLRRANLHARRSYKTTRNVGKLIQDAAKIRARFCVIIESATTAQLKNMDTQEQKPVALSDLPSLIAQR